MDAGSSIDYSKLPPELLAKMQKWEADKPENKQLVLLGDIADMVQELIHVSDQTKKDSEDQIKAIGAVLTDSREQLVALNKKEDPETPDFAKPVVEALSKLEKAISKIEVRPQLNPTFQPNISVDAPKVDVSAPDVKVDTSSIAKILKSDLPKAFNEAIKLVPRPEPTDITPLEDKLKDVIEQLKDIDTGVRLKPQPGRMSVTNTDGTDVRNPTIFREYDDIEFTDPDANGNYQTVTYKNGGSVLYTVSMTFDLNNKATSIVRS